MDKIQEIKKLCEEKQIRMIDFKMTDIDFMGRTLI